jgi:citrate synthase
VDPYSAVAAGVAALYGPLHGGANEQVLRMLASIGSKDRVPEFINNVKAGKAKLMGRMTATHANVNDGPLWS